MNTFFLYLYIILFPIICTIIFLMGIEQIVTVFTRRAPSISAGYKKRDGVIRQIHKEMPNVKTILDIGCGWGAMVNAVAREFPRASVTGIEIMLSPYIISFIRSLFVKNIKIIFGDAFKFLKDQNKKFDIGITYLLTPEMADVESFLSRFKILMSVDFPLPNVKPTRKIKLHKDRYVQHWLYVYNSN